MSSHSAEQDGIRAHFSASKPKTKEQRQVTVSRKKTLEEPVHDIPLYQHLGFIWDGFPNKTEQKRGGKRESAPLLVDAVEIRKTAWSSRVRIPLGPAK